MKVSRLTIQNFRGIRTAELLLPDHAVLIGDNNVGKTTVLEALNLALGPDRLNRSQSVDEHDFYQGRYRAAEEEDPPKILIEATVTRLNEEQRVRFKDYIEWWNEETRELVTSPPPANVDQDHITTALRVVCAARYDEEDDDFVAESYFAKSEEEGDRQPFRKADKQYCGFLYLRSLRTASRALSLERGSLLDIILRIKEIRPQMWERTIAALDEHQVASDPTLGISGVLASVQASIKKFVPREWGLAPHLKVSNLTREHLRKVITAFVATGDGDHAAPFYRQGTGTINLLVLAMLSQIAEDKQNVVFAMEEPETAIPPYAQKRIIHEIRQLSSQSIFTSHSPYVLEEFALPETVILARRSDGTLEQFAVQLPNSVKHKRYGREFRTRFCEALLTRRVLIAEGATEASAIPAAARRLFELNPATYAPLEALGICTLDAGSDSQIADLGGLCRRLGKEVYAVCDKQDQGNKAKIAAEVDELFMHDEAGFENLVLKNTTDAALHRFIATIDWPLHLAAKYPNPMDTPREALADFFSWSKGDRGIADFLGTCEEAEIPEWIRGTCRTLKELCEPAEIGTEAIDEGETQDQEETAGLA